MNRTALDPDGRAELFIETANRRGISPIVVEKDFWVCWTLGKLFENPEESPSLLFKGGTSLSKIFRAIERFSEDIDLSINRHDLGFKDTRDPALARTGNLQKKLLEELEQAKINHLWNKD
ncbi:MAG: nucleotidyl transferase AbiEii/AbiGii toxin family protein [Candidatus Heimdallarchaeota archaeon]|nr:nucleotidyl transferase AbiEii/AbiGii toxin family protein [Candidatus Heimdallarchaeota archaeon]